MRDFYTDVTVALDHIQTSPCAYENVQSLLTQGGMSRARLFFVGNGASASISSHFAADFSKTAEHATFCFNDGAHLTCVSNDIGFENVFWMPIEQHGVLGDVLFAISSSGQSKNILAAVNAAKSKRMNVVTLSGFRPDNPLRSLGTVNFYVPSNVYGVVETVHTAILHSILDEYMERRDQDGAE